MPIRRIHTLVAICATIAAYPLMVPLLSVSVAQTANPPASAEPDTIEPRDPTPPLPSEVLKDEKVIAVGGKLWADQCTHCHGSKAYPDKAPKLQPRGYKPEFVWDRVHNGFRAMPRWKCTYEPDEVVALVAYVLSDDFFP